MKKDKRIDHYISKSSDFAKPVLNHLRKIIHDASPEIIETIKWGMPSFEYKGLLCGMAAFQQHCTFGFWKSSLLKDRHHILEKKSKSAMGNLGRITSLKDLPKDKILIGYILEAMKLNHHGIKNPVTLRKEKKRLVIPQYFISAIKKNIKAHATFKNFSYTNKKEYIEWVTEAKTKIPEIPE